MYVIREAIIEDRENILGFIKYNWNVNHIFVKDESLFDYYYLEHEKINFIIAEENEHIIAILGYLKYNNLNSRKTNDVFLAMWKSCNNSMAGIKCLEYLMNKGYRSISCCGINKKTQPIYKFLGYETGKLNHWYMLNNTLKNKQYKIAKVVDSIGRSKYKENKNKITLMDTEVTEKEFTLIKQIGFIKSYEYFRYKYLEHPYYQYKIYSINEQYNIKALLVAREISINNAKCLRIVDLIGNGMWMKEINLQEILRKNNYEYIDFYEKGMDKKILEKIGLTLRTEVEKNIIPNYFEPFVRENVEIYYMSNYKENFYIFKGDGDQDRPSIAKEKLNE